MLYVTTVNNTKFVPARGQYKKRTLIIKGGKIFGELDGFRVILCWGEFDR